MGRWRIDFDRGDVIATAGDETARAVQQATKTIPIVAIVGDMLESGLVTSLARPEGNTTGVSILVDEADGKRQDILIEAVPGLRLMAVLLDVTSQKTLRSWTHCRRRREHAMSSFQFIVSPKARRSQQPSTVRRHRGPQR
jgi:hypothetical protein